MHSNDPYRKAIWRCNDKFSNEHKCETPTLDEEDIKKAFVEAYNKLSYNKEGVIKDCESLITVIADCSSIDIKILSQTEEVNMIVERVNKIVQENASTPQSQEEYLKKYELLSSRFEEENDKLQSLQKEKEQRVTKKKEIEAFIELYRQQPDLLLEWNEYVFNMMVNKVLVYKKSVIEFEFYNESKVKVNI